MGGPQPAVMYLLAGLRPSSRRSFFDTGIFDTDVFAGLNYYRVDLGSTAQEAFPPTPHRITVPTQLTWGRTRRWARDRRI